MRHQSPAETYGAPALERQEIQTATCGRCGTVVDFDYDAIGRLRERCPICDPQRKRPNPATPKVSQTALTNVPAGAQLLPRVAPGQLRCQRCAHGVDGPTARFCPTCRRRAIAAAVTGRVISAETRAKMSAAMKGRPRPVNHFQERACPCGTTFRPNGPTQIYCTPECPKRVNPYRRKGSGPERVCRCGSRFKGKQGQRYCGPECPARRAA